MSKFVSLLIVGAVIACLVWFQVGRPGIQVGRPGIQGVTKESGDKSNEALIARADRAPQVVRPASDPSKTVDLRVLKVRMATDHAEASAAGLYTLSAAELWHVAQRHPNPEVQRAGCFVSGCLAYGYWIKSKNLGRESTAIQFGSESRRDYFAYYCRGVVDAENPTVFTDPFAKFVDTVCIDPEYQQGLSSKAEDFMSRTDISEEEIIAFLSKTTDQMAMYYYTNYALERGLAIDGIDFNEIRRGLIGDSNQLYELLALKFGCRILGFCDAGSSVLANLCERGMSCMAGDTLLSIAQRNLSPVHFEQWRAAQLKTPSRG